MRYRKTPPLNIRLRFEPLISMRGWVMDIEAVCEFFSDDQGRHYELSVPLKSDAAKKLTDLLLHPQRIPRDFVDSVSERKRISKYIADTLAGIVARQPTAYRKRGYPLRYTKY